MTQQTNNAQRIYSPISCAGLALQDVPLAPRISIEAQDPGMGDDALYVNTLHLCLGRQPRSMEVPVSGQLPCHASNL